MAAPLPPPPPPSGQGPQMASQSPRNRMAARIDEAMMQKDSPQNANLRKATDPAVSCGTCNFYDGTNACSKVAGNISPAEVCDLFESEEERPTQMENGAPTLTMPGTPGAGGAVGAPMIP